LIFFANKSENIFTIFNISRLETTFGSAIALFRNRIKQKPQKEKREIY